MKTVEEEFIQILNFMGIPNDRIKNEASFTNDYDFDDSQFVCLALYIGIFFKINLKDTEYRKLDTVGNAIDFVKIKML